LNIYLQTFGRVFEPITQTVQATKKQRGRILDELVETDEDKQAVGGR